MRNDRPAPHQFTPNVGCEAGLDDDRREETQHTQKYVSIFLVYHRPKMFADGVSRTVNYRDEK